MEEGACGFIYTARAFLHPRNAASVAKETGLSLSPTRYIPRLADAAHARRWTKRGRIARHEEKEEERSSFFNTESYCRAERDRARRYFAYCLSRVILWRGYRATRLPACVCAGRTGYSRERLFNAE